MALRADNPADKPLVSVVIPSYNHAKYVGKTIESIYDQTIFSQAELIVIDDGSSDDSVEVIESKCRNNSLDNVTFIKRENRGLCRTLNEALKMSRGKYFSYIGSDDILAPRKLEMQVEVMEAAGKNIAACYSDSFIIDAEDNIMDNFGRQYPYRSGKIYHDLLWLNFHPPSPTNLFVKEALVSIGGFNDDHFIEDLDTWVRIAQKYDIAYIDVPLAYFRVHGTNTSTSNPGKMYEYFRRVIRETALRDPDLAPLRKSLEANVLCLEAGNYFESLQLGEARRYALKALAQAPANKMAWRTLLLSMLSKTLVSAIRQKRRSKVQLQLAENLNLAQTYATQERPVWQQQTALSATRNS